jgi:hypothetical protein
VVVSMASSVWLQDMNTTQRKQMNMPRSSLGMMGSRFMKKERMVIQKGFVWNRIVRRERGISVMHRFIRKKFTCPVRHL